LEESDSISQKADEVAQRNKKNQVSITEEKEEVEEEEGGDVIVQNDKKEDAGSKVS